jgi:saccharopine dehydrogenase (NAD+, L-lysine-forming)
MIYGANGYTGRLVARLAVRRGERPILAGRSAAAIQTLARELGLPHRVVALGDRAALAEALQDIAAVAHCAGPFEATATPMVDACLATRTHYLDVAGEINVIERVYARHDAAARAGVVLLPGAGFDVVPTDCLAALLYDALPRATTLELAFLAGGGLSPGTFKVSLRILAQGTVRRVDGRLRATPLGLPRRVVPFPSGPREVGAFRTGDLASAYRSTGIPNITVYALVPRARGLLGRAALGAVRTFLSYQPTRSLAEHLASWRVSGPGPQRRARSRSEFWAEVRDRAGGSRSVTMVGPNGYELTADAVLRSVRYLLAGTGPAGPVVPGAHTPATAFGPGFLRELDRVEISDVAVTRAPER